MSKHKKKKNSSRNFNWREFQQVFRLVECRNFIVYFFTFLPKKYKILKRYEMLIGIPPFYHRNQELMFDLIKTSDVKFPSFIDLSESCIDFIKKVISQNYIYFLIFTDFGERPQKKDWI